MKTIHYVNNNNNLTQFILPQCYVLYYNHGITHSIISFGDTMNITTYRTLKGLTNIEITTFTSDQELNYRVKLYGGFSTFRTLLGTLTFYRYHLGDFHDFIENITSLVEACTRYDDDYSNDLYVHKPMNDNTVLVSSDYEVITYGELKQRCKYVGKTYTE